MSTRGDRTAGLRAARAIDSADRRRRAQEAIDALEAGPHHRRTGPARTGQPCAPTSPSPATRFASYAPSATRSATGFACNSAPRSTDPTGPN
jgi:hypothetical protein